MKIRGREFQQPNIVPEVKSDIPCDISRWNPSLCIEEKLSIVLELSFDTAATNSFKMLVFKMNSKAKHLKLFTYALETLKKSINLFVWCFTSLLTIFQLYNAEEQDFISALIVELDSQYIYHC